MDHTRHIGLFQANNTSAAIIGAGGIGAMTGLTLAKMGVGYLEIYDSDVVEEVNLATQFHRLSDVGKPKAAALKEAIALYSDVEVLGAARRITTAIGWNPLIAISAVDSIASRKGIWEGVKAQPPAWYLDARMSAEYFQMFVVNMRSPEWYASTLASQDDAAIPDDPCTSKATIYTACIAAGHIGAAVRRIITGQQAPMILWHDILKNELGHLEMA